MPRSSKFQHLRPIVFQRLEAGKPVTELIQEFSEIPKTTLYDWANRFERERNVRQSDSVQTPPPLSLVPDPPNPAILDFLFAVRVLREIAGDDAAQPAVRVQAAVGLLRASEMKERIPAIAKTSEQKVAVDIRIHREELKSLDASELRKRYLDALENPED
jgi:transposase-like protein